MKVFTHVRPQVDSETTVVQNKCGASDVKNLQIVGLMCFVLSMGLEFERKKTFSIVWTQVRMFHFEESASKHVWLGLEVRSLPSVHLLQPEEKKHQINRKSKGAQKVVWNVFDERLEKNGMKTPCLPNETRFEQEQALSSFSLLDWKTLNPNFLKRHSVCFVQQQMQSSTVEWVPCLFESNAVNATSKW